MEETSCQKDHDCEKKDAKYVKLDVDFVLEKTDLELRFPSFQAVVPTFVIIDGPIVTDIDGVYFNKPPPEKPYGKKLLPFTQSFLC